MTRPTPLLWGCDQGHEHLTEAEAWQCINRRTVASPFGWCPVKGCDRRGASRGVVQEGYDLCESGHLYLSNEALPGVGR